MQRLWGLALLLLGTEVSRGHLFLPHLEAGSCCRPCKDLAALEAHSGAFPRCALQCPCRLVLWECFLVPSPSPMCSLPQSRGRGGSQLPREGPSHILKAAPRPPLPAPHPESTLFPPESLLTHEHWSGHALCGRVWPVPSGSHRFLGWRCIPSPGVMQPSEPEVAPDRAHGSLCTPLPWWGN